MIKVGVIGATGYAGQQLVWILQQHQGVKIQLLSSRSYAEMNLAEVYPNYRAQFEQILLNDEDFVSRLDEIDLLFMALPHGLSQELSQKAADQNIKVIDLGADFRFDEVETYEKWYGLEHQAKALNEEAVYGMPELYRKEIEQARVVASPGCFPTSAILGIAPLLKAKMVDPKSIIVDAKSGTTGAGRSTKTTSLYCEVNENFKPYGVFGHRHTPEIEEKLSRLQEAPVEVIFTPHLLPLNRGILSTIYLDIVPEKSLTLKEAQTLYKDFYKDEPFVRIVPHLPELSHVRGTNLCDLTIRIDEARGKVIVISAIDNLIKGAAGQAVQSMNLMFNLPEESGLNFLSMYI